MAEEVVAEKCPVRVNKGEAVAGIASYWLAILGFFSILGAGVLFCYVFWAIAIPLGCASLVLGRERPRRKRWFLRGTIGISLALGGMVFFYDQTYPSVLKTKIPPVTYVDAPLPEILKDFCQHAHEQQHSVSFAMYERELRDQMVTLRTSREMGLKGALRKLTEAAECSFDYGVCPVGSVVILGHIWIFRKDEFPQNREFELTVEYDRILEQDWACEDMYEHEETERSGDGSLEEDRLP